MTVISDAPQRWNALGWGVSSNALITCQGTTRCHFAWYGVCDVEDEAPIGCICPMERALYDGGDSQLRSSYADLTWLSASAFDKWVHEASMVMVRQQRLRIRTQWAWENTESMPIEVADHEYELCLRYMTAVTNEFIRLLASLQPKPLNAAETCAVLAKAHMHVEGEA